MTEIFSQLFPWSGYILSVVLFIASLWMTDKAPRFISSFLIHLNILVIIPIFIIGDVYSIFFISFPCLALYYYFMYQVAEVVIPSADRGDMKERWNQFKVLVWYSWNLQYPIWVKNNNTDSPPQIPGDFTRPFFEPGIIWADSHHAIVISDQQDEITRVEGPGFAFTKRREHPLAIIDLRTQAQNREIPVATKDGVPLKARLVAPFSIDGEIWTKELYHRLHTSNPKLEKAQKLDHSIGTYPFSSKRVQAAIEFIDQYSSANRAFPGNNLGETVLDRIQPIARKVISQYNINELWELPNEKKPHTLNKISDEITNHAQNILRKHGILLRASRIVDFRFEDDTIPKQKVNDWVKNQKARDNKAIEEAKSEVSLELEKARSEMEPLQSATFKESEINDPDKKQMQEIIRKITRLEDLAKSETNHHQQQSNDDTKGTGRSEKNAAVLLLAEQVKEIILPDILRHIKSVLSKNKAE